MKIGFIIPWSIALLCLSGGFAVADEYAPTSLSADEIIAKMVAATGEMHGGQYLISERSQNGDGTTTNVTTEISGVDFLTLSQTGTATEENGHYHGQYWYRDANGTVLVERGGGLGGSAADVQWLHDESGNVPVHVLGVTSMAPQAYVLSFRMKDGTDVTAYVDVATNVLSRIEYAFSDGGHSTTTYSDYREIFGMKAAFDEVDTEQGFPQNGIETKILSWMESPTSDEALAMPQSQPLVDVAEQTTLPVRFTYQDGTQGDITLTARINGQNENFVLDSGADCFYIDPGAAHALGLAVHGKRRGNMAGPLDVSETTVPEMTIGGLTMHNVAFTVEPADLNDEGVHSVGLLGCDFFSGSVVGLDFKDSTMTLYPRSSFDPTALGAIAVPIRTNDCVAEIAAMFENVPGTFILDTGADATELNHSFLAKLPRSTREVDSSSLDQGPQYLGFLGGEVATQTYAVDDFIFAGTRFRTGDVIVPNNFEISGADGLIGRNVLRTFTVYLDYADGVAFFKLNR